MTEQEWMASEDPAAMLRLAIDANKSAGTSGGSRPAAVIGHHKLRLWVEACRSASGVGPWANKLGAGGDLMAAVSEWSRTGGVSWKEEVPNSTRCDILREIVGNPFRPVNLPGSMARCRCGGDYAPCKKDSLPLPVAVCLKCFSAGPWWEDVADGGPCLWITPTVTSLAHAAYEHRDPATGHLDPVLLLVLADSLEESGCDSASLLSHLRETGPHVRGCWAVDIVLGKS